MAQYLNDYFYIDDYNIILIKYPDCLRFTYFI